MANQQIWNAPIRIEIKNDKALQRALVRMPDRLAEEFHDAIDHIKRKFFKLLKVNMGVKYTRAYWKLYQGSVYPKSGKKKLKNVELRIWTRSKFAEIHERGGTIKPQRKKLLAIPIGDAATKSTGQAKKSFQDKSKIKNLFFINRNGKMYLAQTMRNRSRFLFYLTPSVTVEGKLNFEKTWDELRDFRNQRFEKALDNTVTTMNKGA